MTGPPPSGRTGAGHEADEAPVRLATTDPEETRGVARALAGPDKTNPALRTFTGEVH